MNNNESKITVTSIPDAFEAGETIYIHESINHGFFKTLFCFIFRIKLQRIKYVPYVINSISGTELTITNVKDNEK